MNHTFNVEIAKIYGLKEAVIIDGLRRWIGKNEANKRCYYDGVYWVRGSAPTFVQLFPFMTASQIRRALKSLSDKEAVIKGNYNKSSYDKTAWYSLSDTVKSVYKREEM